MIIKKINKLDLDSLVKVHLSAFDGFFLSSLGQQFLHVYYASCLKDQLTVALGIFDDSEKLIGFATGSIKAKGYHKRILINNIIAFLLSITLKFLKNPKILLRLIKNLNKNVAKNDIGDYAELLSIAIYPEYSGLGYGKVILDKFEKEVKLKGATKIALTTDLNNNDKALTFYCKCGYKPFYEFVTYPNRKMIKMIKNVL